MRCEAPLTHPCHGLIAVFMALVVVCLLVPAHVQAEPTMLDEQLDGPYALAGTLHVSDPENLRVELLVDWQDPDNTYRVTMTPLLTRVERVVAGTAVAIGRTRAHGAFEPEADLELTLRREGWRLELIVDRQVLARAWDTTFEGGQVGYSVTGGALPDAMLQPLGEVYMADDFMRAGGGNTTWEAVSGSWGIESLRVDEQRESMEAEKSANAFSYVGRATEEGPALATTGYWFWSDYSIGAAVRPSGTEAVGVVAYYQDPANYLAARWTSELSGEPDAGTLQIVRVAGGERQVLAQADGGHIPGQWYRLQLRVSEGVVQVHVDDEPRLAATAELFGQGQAGLYTESSEGANFDSVTIQDWTTLVDDFGEPTPGRWSISNGSWAQTDGTLRATGPEAIALTGSADWGRYSWEARARTEAGAIGLTACSRKDDLFVLRLAPAGSDLTCAGQAQIVRVKGGEETILSSGAAEVRPGVWHRLRLVADDGLLAGYLDGERVLDVWHPEAMAGQVGLYAAGGASFDGVYLQMLPPPRIARVTKEFTEGDEHWEMMEWASTRAAWLKPDDEEGAWWTKGDYFGDKTIAFEIKNVESAAGEVRVHLEAAPGDESAGVTLVLATEKGSNTLRATLQSGEETIEEASVEVESTRCSVRFERKGTWVVTTIDGNVVFSVRR